MRDCLIVFSMTFPLKKIAGIACPTVLLLRVHFRACALLELISETWHHCDTAAFGQR